MRLLIPKTLRNATDEELIKQRLKIHFKKHAKILKTDLANRRKRALSLILIGIIIGMVEAIILHAINSTGILDDAVGIIFTPASWYAIWTGFERLVTIPKEEANDMGFYNKMTNAQITFVPY